MPLGTALQSAPGVVAMAARRSDAIVLTANQDGTIAMWDLDRHQHTVLAWRGQHREGASDVAFSADGKVLFSAGYDKRLVQFELEAANPVAKPLLNHGATLQSIAVSADGSLIAVKDGKNRVVLRRVHDTQPPRLVGPKEVLSNIVFAGQGGALLVGTPEGVVWWDTERNVGPAARASPSIKPAFNVAFSSVRSRVAVSGRDGVIHLLDSNTLESSGGPFTIGKGQVVSLEFSRNGQSLASAGADGSIAVWNVSSGELRWRASAVHAGDPLSVRFSPDATMLASGGDDGQVAIWDAATGEPIARWPAHAHRVEAAVFSPDGRTLATAGADGDVILWAAGLAAWRSAACAVAARELTADEWKRFSARPAPAPKVCNR